MPTFEIKSRLPSLSVDKDLIGRIETYFVDSLLPKSGLSAEELVKVYTATIEDGAGSETLRSIAEHLPSQFPDSTMRVTLSLDTTRTWDTRHEVETDIDISFGREPLYTSLSIKAKGTEARDTALAAKAAIERLLEAHRNSNELFWPGAGLEAVIELITIWTLPLGIVLLVTGQVSAGSWIILISVALYAYRYPGRRLRPYTMFDSRADRSREEWWRWFKFGVFSFLLFGTIFTLLRKHLLGF